MHIFCVTAPTEHVHTSVYMSLCEICKCMHVYITVCTCACLNVQLWARMGRLIRWSIRCLEGRTPLRRLSLHSVLFFLRCENEPDRPTTSHYCFHFLLSASGYSFKPCHPALTFLRAEKPSRIPADELLGMLKTAKLRSVTGNLQGLVLTDISDSREGLTLNCTRLSLCWMTSETRTLWGWVALRIPEGLSSAVCSRKTDRLCEGRLFLEVSRVQS